MARTKITKEILIDRLKKKFSNEDGTLIELNSWKLVNEFLKEIRRVAIEYKIEGFEEDALKLYSNDNLDAEYHFRHNEYKSRTYEKDVIYLYWTSKYIDWCYSIGMSEKNQIRKRLEYFDPNYIQENHGLPLTKIMRNYRNLYKEYYE